jgi:ParB family chromosome partitioning protein
MLHDIDLPRVIIPLNQLRSQLENIDELADSIREIGLFHPITVRIRDEENFEIVAGNRRYMACKQLGWRKITCHIVNLDDKEAYEFSLVENIQRNSLQPLDEANAFKAYVTDFGWGGITELASKIGKSVSYITKRIMLLDLPQDVLLSMGKGNLTVSAAEELLAVKDTDRQSELARLISERHLTIKKTRAVLKELSIDDPTNIVIARPDELRRIQRSFDKSIVTFKIAMSGLVSIIENVEDNWVIHELLMQHKNFLHQQIDIMIKERKKYP